MNKAGKQNSKGQYINDFKDSENVKKTKFGIDILDTRLIIRTNNTWRNTEEYSVSLDKQYIKTASNIITKYTSKGSISVDRFHPHKLEAFVFTLQYIVKVPTYTTDERLNEFEEKEIEIASFAYVPIIDKEVVEEEDEDWQVTRNTIYTFRMINIDTSMEVDSKF